MDTCAPLAPERRAPPAPLRLGPQRPRRRWWAVRRGSPLAEILLLAVVYLAYTAARMAANHDEEPARRHARQILSLERWAHIDVEARLNAAITHVPVAEIAASYWYASLHYLVTPLALVLLYRRRPDLYRRARTALVGATVTALGFYLFLPTAPPRLLGGYTDVLAATARWGWWGADASAPRGMGGSTNQLAAMPSLHVGWALWSSLALAHLLHRRWQRVLTLGYAATTAVVVVVTGNHWILDAVAGIVLVLAFRPFSLRTWTEVGWRPSRTVDWASPAALGAVDRSAV